MNECICGYRNGTTKIANDGVIRSAEKGKGPSTKDVRQMGRGVVLKFRTFPDGGRGGGL